MRVVVAEKRDQAIKLAAPFHTKMGDGYIEALPCATFPKGAYFVWAQGHLVSLKEPEDYDEKFKNWSLDLLPIIPDQFKFQVIKQKSKLFNTVKKLLNDPKVTEVVCGTDPGREGQYIFQNMYILSGCKKPVKRLWSSSLTKNAIEKAFHNLLPNNEKMPLFYEAYARSVADWLVGMNTTRAYTVLLKNKGHGTGKEPFSTGRVQTPVLALIVKREEDMENFVSTSFWEIYADFEINGHSYRGKWFTGEIDRLDVQDKAEKLAAYCQGKSALVEEVTTEQKEFSPPHLFSLSALQTVANRRYQINPEGVLAACQSLYDKGYTSYPRTSSDAVTEEEAKTFPEVLEKLQKYEAYKDLIPTPKNSLLGNKRYVDPARVSDHYALIPTENTPDFNELNDNEKKIYDLIARSLIAAHYDNAIFDYTTILTYVDDKFSFATKGKMLIKDGWRKVIFPNGERDEVENDDNGDQPTLPNVNEGERGMTANCEAKEGKTQPPKRFTEGDLIGVMKSAGKDLDDKNLEKIMKETQGLGTEATRASIIKTLKDRGYIEVKKNLVFPTPKGRTLIKAIRKSVLSSAEMTAVWESKLAEIGSGQASHQSFIENAKKLVTKLISDAIETINEMPASNAVNQPAGQTQQEVSEPEAADPAPPERNTPDTGSEPDLYKKAVNLVLESRQASVSLLQRRLHIGYTQAARFIDQMEEEGIIGPYEGSFPRKILIDQPHPSADIVVKQPDESNQPAPLEEQSADQKAAESEFGLCAKCQSPMVDKGKMYGCSAYSTTAKCDFTISKTILGATVSKEDVKRLLTDGQTGLIRGFTKKGTDTKFDAVLTLNNGKLGWRFPNIGVLKMPTSLLNAPTSKQAGDEDMKKEFEVIENMAQAIKLPAKVKGVSHGPRVTRFELLPEDLSLKIKNYNSYKLNFQAALKAEKISMYIPIPGTNKIGIEIPNKKPYVVNLRTLLENKEYLAIKKDLSFPIGLNMSGNPAFGNLADMPHLLVAGTTGSGKSVFINSLIVSLLYSCSSDELKFVFIDPKRVELSVYNGIPHLFGPIVNDPRKAEHALQLLVREMEKRYDMFEKVGVRNITGYNEKLLANDPNAKKMPYIVLIIDELADLMMTTAQTVEDLIMRLSQLARAAGIHLIVATQRPSKQVISGVIKANLPVRIAFAVASHIDSQVILDEGGAEDLLGKGDMFYLPKDGAKQRLVSAFVSDEEIERVVKHLTGEEIE